MGQLLAWPQWQGARVAAPAVSLTGAALPSVFSIMIGAQCFYTEPAPRAIMPKAKAEKLVRRGDFMSQVQH